MVLGEIDGDGSTRMVYSKNATTLLNTAEVRMYLDNSRKCRHSVHQQAVQELLLKEQNILRKASLRNLKSKMWR